MLNSAALRLALLVATVFIGIAAIGYEPTSASVANGRACSASAAPTAPISSVTAPFAPIAHPIAPVMTPPPKRIPAPPAHKGKTLVLEVSAYTSTKGQTDGDPCIIKRRINICRLKRQGHNICASNVFPEGTRVRIEGVKEIDGICTVMDSMASDRTRNIDWYFGEDPKDNPKGPLWKKAMAVGRGDHKVTVISTP